MHLNFANTSDFCTISPFHATLASCLQIIKLSNYCSLSTSWIFFKLYHCCVFNIISNSHSFSFWSQEDRGCDLIQIPLLKNWTWPLTPHDEPWECATMLHLKKNSWYFQWWKYSWKIKMSHYIPLCKYIYNYCSWINAILEALQVVLKLRNKKNIGYNVLQMFLSIMYSLYSFQIVPHVPMLYNTHCIVNTLHVCNVNIFFTLKKKHWLHLLWSML